MKRSILGQIFIFILLSTSCAEDENIIPMPSISVSYDFISNWSGHIKGQTFGVDPDLFHLAIYAEISGLWFNLPDAATPIIPISTEQEWFCQLETLDIDRVSEVVIFLLPNSFNPPVLIAAKNIPTKLNVFSAAKQRIILRNSSM
jgi:hypothetical protein